MRILGLVWAVAQAGPRIKPDQERVDAAIERGAAWLLTREADFEKAFQLGWVRHQPKVDHGYLELIVLTLAHSAYGEENPKMAQLVQKMTAKKIVGTYQASIQAMALGKIDPKKYQWRIAQCAQFLVDNQCENGQWDYGQETEVDRFQSAAGRPIVISTESQRPMIKKSKTEILPKVSVRAKKRGPPSGDNSNAQYAALGLRACLDAGITVERGVLALARDWWLKSQNKDGGWGYNPAGAVEPARAPDPPATIGNASYGSMTGGAVGAISIYRHYLGESCRNDQAVLRGLEWIAENYSVKNNPRKSVTHFYWLYALERTGILLGSERIGGHDWYAEGARVLLETQQADGTWDAAGEYPGFPITATGQTCFSILFLRRATRPLVKIETKSALPATR